MYATDASNYRQVPIGLVIPKDADDVERALAACRSFGAPIVSRGGGTSLAGETCNAAVVLDFSKYMNRIVAIDWEAKTARVQPGCVNDDLRDEAEKRHLTFGPDPATHNRNTFGGMIGNNSCGMHAQMAGKTEENVEGLDIVTYDGLRLRVGKTPDKELEQIIADGGRKGDIYRQLRALRDKYADKIREIFPNIPRRVSGFPLQRAAARKRLQRRARTGRHGEYLRHDCRGDGSFGAESAASCALRFSVFPTWPRRPITCHSVTSTADRARGNGRIDV